MSIAISSCSDVNTPTSETGGPGSVKGSDYSYNVRIAVDVNSRVVVIDSVIGNVSNIVSSEAWLTAKQDGTDGEQHPVLLLSTSEESNIDRTATVSFTSSDNKQVAITVLKQGDTGGNSGETALPEVTSLNKAFYQDWYEGASGKVYITESSDRQTWMKRALPWADNALGSVPPYVSEEMKKTKADWRLVYSTLGLESTSGANFFTLYNNKQSKLRFFYYIPAGYINNASTAWFVLEQYNPSKKFSIAFNGNESKVMPLAVQNAGKLTVGNNYDPQGTQTMNIIPIGTGQTRAITSGWVCFDVSVDGAYINTAKEALEDASTRLTLRLATTLAGSIETKANLHNDGDLKMDAVKLVKKGSSLAAAATFFNGFGTSLFQVGAGIASIANPTLGAGGTGAGIVQIVGGVSTFVGTCLNTAAADQDSKQSFEGSVKVDFNTNGSINGSLTYNTINALPAITFKPEHFKYKWETLLSGSPAKWANSSTRAAEDPAGNTLPTYGLMTMVNNPVVYVSADHVLYNPASYPASYQMSYDKQLIECVTNDDEQLRFISFLDPSTVEVYINKEMMGFDFDEAEIYTSLVTNAGPYDVYQGPDPYFGYYQLKNEQVQLTTQDDSFINLFSEQDTKSVKRVACKNEEIPTISKGADLDAAYKVSELPVNDNSVDTQETGFNYRCYGLTGSVANGARNIVADPIVYVPTNKTHNFIYNKSYLGPLYVAVVVRLIKGNTMQIVSKHFLPEVRTFKSSEIATIRDRINQGIPTQVKTNLGKMTAKYEDTGWLKSRALKMLELAGK